VYVGTEAYLMVYGLLPSLSSTAGNNQSAPVNTPINITASDLNPYNGVPTTGATVTFSDGGRGGTFNPPSVSTDQNGNAATVYTMPQTSGAVTITASSSGIGSTTFSETANPGNPASISVISGTSQSGVVTTTLPAALVVKVKDTYGNIVPGASVTYSDGGLNGSSFNPNPAVTSNTGVASAVYTLPTVAKQGYAVTASSGSATPATFHETSQAGAPASIVGNGGSKQSGAPGATLPKPLQVIVRDQYKNPVPNVTVTFTDNGAGGTFSTTTPVTNGSGDASVTYTMPSGASNGTIITITASVNGQSVNFTETVN
jgi:hypothetical protein